MATCKFPGSRSVKDLSWHAIWAIKTYFLEYLMQMTCIYITINSLSASVAFLYTEC